jgi:Negative regulator of sigma F
MRRFGHGAVLAVPASRINPESYVEGATIGALAGLSGLAVLGLFCPNLNEYHILVWHFGSVLVSTGGGLAIGTISEYSSWRRVPRAE